MNNRQNNFSQHPCYKSISPEQSTFIHLAYVEKKVFPKIASEMKVNDKQLRVWNKELREVWRPISQISNLARRKEIEAEFFYAFHEWYTTTPRRCEYCGIDERQIAELQSKGLENKRTTRGLTLEIDRKDPSLAYNNVSNLALACYWCNNAKTDTFTFDEFKRIGAAIAEVWQSRLQDAATKTSNAGLHTD